MVLFQLPAGSLAHRQHYGPIFHNADNLLERYLPDLAKPSQEWRQGFEILKTKTKQKENNMSHMSIDQFFTEIADIEFVWQEDDGTFMVRTPVNRLCPVCALAFKQGKPIDNNGQWQRAAKYIGLSDDDAASIVTAADTDAIGVVTMGNSGFIAGTIRERLAALITT